MSTTSTPVGPIAWLLAADTEKKPPSLREPEAMPRQLKTGFSPYQAWANCFPHVSGLTPDLLLCSFGYRVWPRRYRWGAYQKAASRPFADTWGNDGWNCRSNHGF